MRPPFTAAEFLDAFRRYNEAVFPAQGVLLVIGIVAVGAALQGSRAGSRGALAMLGLLWLWTAVAYHLAFFTAVSGAGYLFAAASAFEGLVVLRLASAPNPPRLAARADAHGIAAAILLGYAIVGYPIAAAASGHHYPAMPTFGAPCPTTIFTIGLLLLVVDRVPRTPLVVPMAWVLVATTAALAFGMWEDAGALVAGLVAATLLTDQSRRGQAAAPRGRPTAPRAVTHRRLRRAARVVAGLAVAFVAGYAAYAAAAWLRYGRPASTEMRTASALDRYIPVYEVRERHETRVDASPAAAFASACAFDLYDSRLVRTIFDARELVMLRRRPRPHVNEPFLHSVQAMGWGMLAASGQRELVFGAVTRPWEGDVVFRALPPTEFAAFDEPGYAKIVWSIAVDPDSGSGSRVRTETRVVTTDPGSRARFRRYWSLASPGIVLIRREALALVKRDAESSRSLAHAPAPSATMRVGAAPGSP